MYLCSTLPYFDNSLSLLELCLKDLVSGTEKCNWSIDSKCNINVLIVMSYGILLVSVFSTCIIAFTFCWYFSLEDKTC